MKIKSYLNNKVTIFYSADESIMLNDLRDIAIEQNDAIKIIAKKLKLDEIENLNIVYTKNLISIDKIKHKGISKNYKNEVINKIGAM